MIGQMFGYMIGLVGQMIGQMIGRMFRLRTRPVCAAQQRPAAPGGGYI